MTKSDDGGCCGCVILILAVVGFLFIIGAIH